MKYLNIGMISCLIYLIGCRSNPVKNNDIEEIRHFINNKFQRAHNKNQQISKIDTIIKLKNGNFFVIINKEIENASSSGSGSFDCLEIRRAGGKYFIKDSILGLGDSTGGSGLNNLVYQFAYLTNSDYLLIVNKQVTNHGNYDLLYLILNSRIKLFETNLIDDYSGITYGTPFSELVQLDSKNGIMKKILFRNLKVSPTAENGVFDLHKKYFEISNSDIDIKLNKINKIKLIKEVHEKSN